MSEGQRSYSSSVTNICFFSCWFVQKKGLGVENPPAFDAVVAFKRKFYRCSWAHYELATSAEISLMPPEHARTTP